MTTLQTCVPYAGKVGIKILTLQLHFCFTYIDMCTSINIYSKLCPSLLPGCNSLLPIKPYMYRAWLFLIVYAHLGRLSTMCMPQVHSFKQFHVSGIRMSFSVVAPALWNNIPPKIHVTLTLQLFRKLLKTLLIFVD